MRANKRASMQLKALFSTSEAKSSTDCETHLSAFTAFATGFAPTAMRRFRLRGCRLNHRLFAA